MKPTLAIVFLALIAVSGCLGEGATIANWPDGHKSAAVLSFDVEQSQAKDIKRIVGLLDKYNATATFFVVAGYYDGVEETLEPLHRFEVASKGWRQDEWPSGYTAQKGSIKRAHSWLSSNGFRPVGFRAPFLKSDEETIAALTDLGYKYDSSKTGLLPSRSDGVIELPLSVAYDPFWSGEVEDYLPLLYLSFEKTLDDEGLFLFYTLPEHADERFEVFLKHLSGKDLWITTGEEVSLWWEKREKVSLLLEGDTAVVTNNGPVSIQGVTLKTVEGYKVLPEIKQGETLRIKI